MLSTIVITTSPLWNLCHDRIPNVCRLPVGEWSRERISLRAGPHRWWVLFVQKHVCCIEFKATVELSLIAALVPPQRLRMHQFLPARVTSGVLLLFGLLHLFRTTIFFTFLLPKSSCAHHMYVTLPLLPHFRADKDTFYSNSTQVSKGGDGLPESMWPTFYNWTEGGWQCQSQQAFSA